LKLPRFEYHAPDSLEEVLGLLAEYGDEAKVLAGGQSLVPLLAMRLARPAHLVDINQIPALRAIEERGDTIALGATVRQRVAEHSDAVRRCAPLLAEALPLVGHVAIRNRGTIGGSLAHADPAAEVPAVAVAVDGEVLLRSVQGERTVPAAELFAGYFTTALDAQECLIELRLPRWPAGAGWAFEEFTRRSGDFAIVGAAAMVCVDSEGVISHSRISLSGVADTPVRASVAEESLVGARPGPAAFSAAAEAATAKLAPPSDVHGSAAFRRHVAGVTVRRALARAAQRAMQGTTGDGD